MGSQELFANVDAVWIAAGLLLGMLLVNEVGYRSGLRVFRRSPATAEGGKGQLDGALSLLLGLFLAFSFSLAAGRFESRQQLVVDEANAIGTAFLRCDLMDEASRPVCRQHFREYTDLRIQVYESSDDRDKLAPLVRQSEGLQATLWALMAQAARQAPSTNTSLTLQAMNEVIDRHGERVAAYRRHVPGMVTGMLFCLCLVWAMSNGYGQGTANRRSLLGWTAFAVLISMVIYIIFDFDRQNAGLIQLDASKSLYDLRASMGD